MDAARGFDLRAFDGAEPLQRTAARSQACRTSIIVEVELRLDGLLLGFDVPPSPFNTTYAAPVVFISWVRERVQMLNWQPIRVNDSGIFIAGCGPALSDLLAQLGQPLPVSFVASLLHMFRPMFAQTPFEFSMLFGEANGGANALAAVSKFQANPARPPLVEYEGRNGLSASFAFQILPAAIDTVRTLDQLDRRFIVPLAMRNGRKGVVEPEVMLGTQQDYDPTGLNAALNEISHNWQRYLPAVPA